MRPVRLVLSLLLLGAAAPLLAQANSAPVVQITTPLTFRLIQGTLDTQVQAVERAQTAASFYDYFSASSHTGFEAPNESKLFLYRDTTTGLLSLFITHNIDFDSSGISTGPGAVTFDISGVPAGAFVAQSDDPMQGGRPELDLALNPEGDWNYQNNTDGGVIDGLPDDQEWCITIDPLLFSNVNSWVYHYASGASIPLDMSQPVQICLEPSTDVTVLDVDEGRDASLSGSFDDANAADTHAASWALGDGATQPATFSPGAGSTHHDVDPLFHAYGDDGSYSAVLSVTDSAGATGSDAVTVRVRNLAPTAALSSPSSVFLGVPAAMSADGDDPGSDDLTFTWSFGDGSPARTTVAYNDGLASDPYPSAAGVFPFHAEDATSHVYCETGLYIVRVDLVDDDGGASYAQRAITVFPSSDPGECNSPPSCSAGGDVAASCDGIQLGGSASDPDGDAITVAWTSSCPGTTFAPSADVLAPVVTLGGSCGLTCTLTLTVTDAHGATCADSLVASASDQTPPAITAGTIAACYPSAQQAEAAALAATSATDSCTAVQPLVAQAQGTCATTVRVTATDGCGNASFVDYPTTIDGGAPVLNGVPSDATVECSAVPAPASVGASDACDPSPVVTFSETRTEGSCVGSWTLQRTWTARDACGNTSSATQVVTVLDRVAPVLNGVPSDATVECSSVPSPASVGASDACDPSPVVTFSETRTEGACVGSWTLRRTWTARDACGNTSSATQLVTVLDRVAPVLNGVPSDATVECSAVPSPANVGATDACEPSPFVTFNETRTNGSCVGSWTLRRTWTARDACGNTSSATQVVTVLDRVAPVLNGVPSDATVECSAVPSPASVGASDACDPSPVVTFNETRTNGSCVGSWTLRRTWTARDACGNTSSATQVLTVLDRVAPVLNGVPADATVECSAVPSPASVGASDACDPSPVVTFSETRTNGACVGSWTLRRTWTARDACGNTSSATQVLTVLDRVAPVLSGVPADATVECSAVPAPATPGASDACDPSPVVTFNETRTNGSCVGSWTLRRTWTARDSCGNVSSATQVLTVLDRVAPLLSGVPADATVDCAAVPAPATPTATDACDPSPVVTFAETRIDGDCPGRYELRRTWTATDSCRNASSATQVLTVTDTTPPAVTESRDTVACLWPPNHRMACFSRDVVSPLMTDDCSPPIAWRITGCASDQPDDGLGDGSTDADCQVAADGMGFCVRAERQGMKPEGRRYLVTIVATDACGNSSLDTIVGAVYVPHDQSPKESGCVKGSR